MAILTENNLENDIYTAEWLRIKAKTRNSYAQNLYAAMCNREFVKLDVLPILKGETWSCSWRYAGGLVAELVGEGDYLNWYCSGMGGLATYDTGDPDEFNSERGYVKEGVVTDEIREDLKKLGWIVLEEEKN